MMIDFETSPDAQNKYEQKEIEETSKSLEWILDKNIDKKKRDEICKIIGEEDTRNTIQEDYHTSDSKDRNSQDIEVEEIKRVRFGNSMIKNENIGEENQEENTQSNLGQYIE